MIVILFCYLLLHFCFTRAVLELKLELPNNTNKLTVRIFYFQPEVIKQYSGL